MQYSATGAPAQPQHGKGRVTAGVHAASAAGQPPTSQQPGNSKHRSTGLTWYSTTTGRSFDSFSTTWGDSGVAWGGMKQREDKGLVSASQKQHIRACGLCGSAAAAQLKLPSRKPQADDTLYKAQPRTLAKELR